jgi:hypothetical protein
MRIPRAARSLPAGAAAACLLLAAACSAGMPKHQGGYFVKGKALDQWRDLTSQQGKLPVQLRGSTAIPSPRPST